MKEFKKVLFICQANVGRSQMAEAFYNHFTNSTAATSGAVRDFGKKYNYRPTESIVKIMSEVGIDISHQRIKLVTEEMMDAADLVVVLCEESLCFSFVKDNKKTIFRHIEDPFEQDEHTMKRIRDEIEVLVKEIIDTYNT